ncbi:MAG: hypothetical protein NXY57DRAFT_1044728, partial [Lentinula lateritia]
MSSEVPRPSTNLADKRTRKGLRSATSAKNNNNNGKVLDNEPLTTRSSSPLLDRNPPVSPTTHVAHSLPNSPVSSTASSDDDAMTTRLNESGNIELSSGKYGPRVKTAAILSPEDLDDLYEEARRYAKTRSTDSIESVREVIVEAFPARVHHDWFRAEKVSHLTLALELKDDDDLLAPPTFPFLDVLRRKFCGHDWAQVHAARRDDLRMSVGGVGCFDEYLSQVEGCNNRLKGVGNYFTPPQLLTILARGITLTLTAILSEQGIVVDETTMYKAWVTSCRDFEVCFKARLAAADHGGHRVLFHRTNEPLLVIRLGTPTSALLAMPLLRLALSKMPEAMQKEQRELLGCISACVKCRTAWDSCASNLDKCTGATLSVPWRPLTNEMVDWAIAAHKSTGRPILYNAILKQAATTSSSSSVAAIHGLLLDDISAYVGNQPPAAAAVYGARSVAYVAQGTNVYGSYAGPSFRRAASTSSQYSTRAVAPVVGHQRLTRDDQDEDVDWSDGSISPSPSSRRQSQALPVDKSNEEPHEVSKSTSDEESDN